MKTNFKKSGLVAGIALALTGASMSANATIAAVAAPAALIPLFVVGADTKTTVRIEVPQAVGVDAILNVFGTPTVSDVTVFPKESSVAVGLSRSLTLFGGNLLSEPTSNMHWFFMDQISNELEDSEFPVSANDVVEFDSDHMPSGIGNDPVELAPYAGGLLNTKSGYLVLTTQLGADGEDPNFSFQADAWLTVGEEGGAETSIINNIPVVPLSDTADGAQVAPSLENNVIELTGNIPAGAPYGFGPVVSPIIAGNRIAISDANGAPRTNIRRIIDIPFVGASADPASGSSWIVWSDRNAQTNVIGGTITYTPAISGSLTAFDCDEDDNSRGSLSIGTQLTLLQLGTVPSEVGALNANPVAGHVANGLLQNAPVDTYGNSIQVVNPKNMTLSECKTEAANLGPGLFTSAAQGFNTTGFLRWSIAPNAKNVGNLKSAAYQSAFIFRLRNSNTDGYSQLPIDRGFFSTN